MQHIIQCLGAHLSNLKLLTKQNHRFVYKMSFVKRRRQRDVNYTKEEVEKLVNIIKSKKTKNRLNSDTWKQIEVEFNRTVDNVYRDREQLRFKFEALKKGWKKRNENPLEQDGNYTKLEATQRSNNKQFHSESGEYDNEEDGSIDFVDLTDGNMDVNGDYENGEEEEPLDSGDLMYTDIGEQNNFSCDETETNDDDLKERKMQAANLQIKILEEELQGNRIRRAKELQHRQAIHELQRKEMMLKIQILERQL